MEAMRRTTALGAILAGSALAGCATPMTPAATATLATAQGCAALLNAGGWRDPTLRILSADERAEGLTIDAGQGAKTPPLPAHC